MRLRRLQHLPVSTLWLIVGGTLLGTATTLKASTGSKGSHNRIGLYMDRFPAWLNIHFHNWVGETNLVVQCLTWDFFDQVCGGGKGAQWSVCRKETCLNFISKVEQIKASYSLQVREWQGRSPTTRLATPLSSLTCRPPSATSLTRFRVV